MKPHVWVIQINEDDVGIPVIIGTMLDAVVNFRIALQRRWCSNPARCCPSSGINLMAVGAGVVFRASRRLIVAMLQADIASQDLLDRCRGVMGSEGKLAHREMQLEWRGKQPIDYGALLEDWP